VIESGKEVDKHGGGSEDTGANDGPSATPAGGRTQEEGHHDKDRSEPYGVANGVRDLLAD
jgi:hypothetical protein